MSAIELRRAGAISALRAMTKVRNTASAFNDTSNVDGDTLESMLRSQACAVRAVTEAAGELSPFLSGFIEAMAEYIYSTQNGGPPELSLWKPDAALTATELAEYRASLEAWFHEGVPA